MIESLVWFCERALWGMRDIVIDLGDDLANRRPDLPGANSPFVILSHCLGVVEYWGGHLVSGRSNHRDRPSEFRSHGSVSDLGARVDSSLEQLRRDVDGVDPRQGLAFDPDGSFQGPERSLDKGGALLHILEELAQHHGQMELTRDLLRNQ